jgi:hypothetical protein
MKVIIEVERTSRNFIRHIRCDGTDTFIYEKDCELVPDQEGWLTEEQFFKIRDLIDNCQDTLNCKKRTCIECDLEKAKKLGYVKQSISAKQKFEEYAFKFKMEWPNHQEALELIDLAHEVFDEEAEKK